MVGLNKSQSLFDLWRRRAEVDSHHVYGLQPIGGSGRYDSAARVKQFLAARGADGLGVLDQGGNGVEAGSMPSNVAAGRRAGIGPAGESTSCQRLRARSCGCSRNEGTLLIWALAIFAASRRATASSRLNWANTSFMIWRRAGLLATRSELLLKRCSRARFWPFQDLSAKQAPFPLVLDG